jgi:integrating conjugative element protein (TIGR03759 family)
VALASELKLTYSESEKIGLNQIETDRYNQLISTKVIEKEIMDDPILVLGLYSDTDEQREKYAQMYYTREVERANRVSRFMAVYQKVFDENAAGQNLLNDMLSGPTPQNQSTGFKNTKLVIFVEMDCDSCGDYVNRIQLQIKSGWVRGIDVYFIDQPTPDQVNDWASQNGIDVDLVKQRKITLNIDSQLANELGIAVPGKVYVRIGDSLSELTLKDTLGMFK